MGLLKLTVWPLVLGGLLAGSAIAGVTAEDAERARLLGALVHTRVAVHFDGVAAEDAFRLLSAAIGEPIIGRYSSEPVGHGIDPGMQVTVFMDDVSALLALEMILEQAATDEPVTWQLRLGYIEVGTKERLARPAAAELRVYSIRDLMIEPAYFAAFAAPSTHGFTAHPYAAAAITRPADARLQAVTGSIAAMGAASYTARKRPGRLSREIAETIVEVIEPGNWDFGQQEIDDLDDDPPMTAAQVRRYMRHKKIARIRIFEDKLLIVAPDFIHRQVDGYPPPIPPLPLTDQERQDRTARSTGGDNGITVLGIAEPLRSTDP